MVTKEKPVSSSLTEQLAEDFERRAMKNVRKPDPNINKTIAELRVKLDTRTWMLRFSLSLNFFFASACFTLIVTLLTILL
jgi:hypothetical protein